MCLKFASHLSCISWCSAMRRRAEKRAKRRSAAKYRRWAFIFAPGSAAYLQRKIKCLRRILGRRFLSHLRLEDVSETRVDVLWPRAVGLKRVLRVVRLANAKDHNFTLQGEPQGIEDDCEEQKGSREKKNNTKSKDSAETHDKKNCKGKKEKKRTPKKRKKKKKSTCVPAQKSSKCTPAKKKSTKEQPRNTLENYFIRRDQKREPSPSSESSSASESSTAS